MGFLQGGCLYSVDCHLCLCVELRVLPKGQALASRNVCREFLSSDVVSKKCLEGGQKEAPRGCSEGLKKGYPAYKERPCKLLIKKE